MALLGSLEIAFNLATIAGVLGIVALLISFTRDENKKDMKKTLNLVGVGFLVVFLLPVLGVFTEELGSPLGGTVQTQAVTVTQPRSPVQPVSIASPTLCAVEDTTVTLSAINQFTAVAAGGRHMYRINDNPTLITADAGTLTASPGDTLDILWMNETTAENYFSAVSKEVVPCAGTKTFSIEVVQNGSITIEVFNEEGNLISEPENETLAAGDVVTLESNLKGQYQRGFPYGGVMVVEFNGTGTSQIDDVILDYGGQETSVPSIYAITLGTNSKTKAYTVPPLLSNQIIRGSIVIDADDSNDPTSNSDITLRFYPNDYFTNQDNGGRFDGPAVEDEDDVQTFQEHDTSYTLSLD